MLAFVWDVRDEIPEGFNSQLAGATASRFESGNASIKFQAP